MSRLGEVIYLHTLFSYRTQLMAAQHDDRFAEQ